MATEEAAALCSFLLAQHSLSPQSLLLQPSVCPEAGPVSLSLFNLQLFWKAKFHEPVVFSHLLPSLHTYLPTSLHIDFPTHFSFFPCVFPNGLIHSSLVTIQVKEIPDIYTTDLSGSKAPPTHGRLPEAHKDGLFSLGSVGMLLKHCCSEQWILPSQQNRAFRVVVVCFVHTKICTYRVCTERGLASPVWNFTGDSSK